MTNVVQIVGAILILTGFAATQLDRLDPKSVSYLALNAAGAAVLAAVALIDRDWGFLLLEGVWTVVSALSLAGVIRRRATRPARPPARPA